MKMHFVIAALALTCIEACDASEILDPKVGSASSGLAPLSVERDKHFGTNRLPAFIFLDGKVVASIKGGEAVVIFVQPGARVVGATLARDAAKPDMSIVVDAKLDRTTMLQAHLGNWGWSGMEIRRME